MHAILLTDIGNKYRLRYSQVPTPNIGKDEALVKIAYCGVNHLDLLIASGKRIGPKKLPHILGSEIVGTIEKISSSTTYNKGDTVAVYPWNFCGTCELCMRGNEQLCENGGTIGRTCWGGYAEYVRVPVHNLVKISKKLSLELLSAVILAGTTAYHLIQRAGVTEKDTVLVTGATGGVGLLVIQLLQAMHCHIIAVSSSPEKISKLKKMGVDVVLETSALGVQAAVLYPRGFDRIIDIMGGSVWSEAVKLLAKRGTISFCATTLADSGVVGIGRCFSSEANIHGSYGGSRNDLLAVIRLLSLGVIHPIIHSTILLPNAATGLSLLENRCSFGKVTIKNQT